MFLLFGCFFTLLHLVFSVVMIQGGMKNDEKRKICKNPSSWAKIDMSMRLQQ
jgi:hypothetical protein